jgi:hypothetical protein
MECGNSLVKEVVSAAAPAVKKAAESRAKAKAQRMEDDDGGIDADERSRREVINVQYEDQGMKIPYPQVRIAAAYSDGGKEQQLVLLLAEVQRKLLATPNDTNLLAEFDSYTRDLAHLEGDASRQAFITITNEKLKPRKPIGGAGDGYGESWASKVTSEGAKDQAKGTLAGGKGKGKGGHVPGQSFALGGGPTRPANARTHLASGMADVKLDIGGLDDLREQARTVLNQKEEVKKRTLDQLILQEVETLLDQKDEREATLEEDGQVSNVKDAWGEKGTEGETMVTVAFDPGPLGMAFAKNRNGYFVVQSISGQSKTKNVKVGDVIVTINDEMVEAGWSRRDVVDMIRAFTGPQSEEPLMIIFDRQFRNSSVNIIKQRVIERKQNKGPAGR